MMKIQENAFAFACAAAFALIWIICSLFVVALPNMMSDMTGKMLHTDWQAMGWHMSVLGVLIGGVLWAFLAGILGWLIAKIYNMQLRDL
ncbi:DUF5676 family membrane protein [Alteromonas sp. KUL106]|uniref:DUF5676 family membrane protein n=1 Tax=unclassified Alteromonas TaxID=2614992 RepID=UPI001F421EEA|nr:DUF5676 family membrane protein [Alteromonas sp. KUL106]